MRKGVVGLVFFLTISFIPAHSATPPKAGSLCSKQGITKTHQGKKFTCIKTGKKLVWNKGVKISLKTKVSPNTRPKLDLYAGISNPIPGNRPSQEMTILTSDGRTRTYRFFKPLSIDSTVPAPLVVALHGGLGSASQFEANSRLTEFAESNGLYVVYPNGISASATEPIFQTWNAGDCCGPAVRSGVDDVAFIASLIKFVRSNYLVDSNRIIAIGHSNGGMLAYKLACELSDQIKGIGIQSASLGMNECKSSTPVKVIHIHGTADTNFPLEGGLGSGVANTSFRSARFAVDTLVGVNRCSKDPAVVRDDENSDITVYSWIECSNSVGIRYITVDGASHAWMGGAAQSSSAQSLVGTPYLKLDSTRALLSFLLSESK